MNVPPTSQLRSVGTEAELRDLVGEPAPAIAQKVIRRVDEQSRRFIAASPLFLLATAGPDGQLDVSPRGDPPGSVLVPEDGQRLVFAERMGNRRVDGMRNLLSEPHVGMLFLVPGTDAVLRVNGRGTIVRDAALSERLALDGKPPQLAIVVEIDELFLHCGRALKLAALWEPASWPSPEQVPAMAEIAQSQRAERAAGWAAPA